MDYVTIDFEASCLPLEVGISGDEGVQSWLIRPGAGWQGWDWTAEALKLHGIHRDRLVIEGQPPHQVFAELSVAIAGRRVIADSRIDNYWWNMLAGAAGEESISPIVDVGAILDELGVTTEAILVAQSHADRLCPARHRAADDARWLWTLLKHLDDRVSVSDGFAVPLPLPPTWSPGLAA
jgi:hypothetical protein